MTSAGCKVCNHSLIAPGLAAKVCWRKEHCHSFISYPSPLAMFFWMALSWLNLVVFYQHRCRKVWWNSFCCTIYFLILVLGGNSCFSSGEFGGGSALELGYVLLCMWMPSPNQASSLQGAHSVNCGFLAVENWGIGSGWQQSKQNSVLLAVVG